ncbi:MAG: DUF349 domain-containing protein [Bacteroidales bacterium]
MDIQKNDSEGLLNPQKYERMTRMAMVQELSKALDTSSISDLRLLVDELKVLFYKKIYVERQALLKQYLENGGERENFVAPLDELEEQFKNLLQQYRQKRVIWSGEQEKLQQDNLAKKEALIVALESLHERTDDFVAVFRDFKQLQTEWRLIGVVPPAKQNELWSRYTYQVERFYDFVKINRELREIDFKKNLELKTTLCEKAEALFDNKDVIVAFKQLQELHEEWRDIGPVAPEHRASIWERFKLLTKQIYKRHQDFFTKQKEEQLHNLELKKNVILQLQNLAETKSKTLEEWKINSDLFLKLQKEWSRIGSVPRKEGRILYGDFQKVCDLFFEIRRKYFKERRERIELSLKEKVALCEQAESLAESSDWKQTTDRLMQLQLDWKSVGSTSYRHSDAIWLRFRTACNVFFDRKKAHFSAKNIDFETNLKAKQIFLKELKEFKPKESHKENLLLLNALTERWLAIGFVPIQYKERIQEEYHTTLNDICKRLKLEESEIQQLFRYTRTHSKTLAKRTELSERTNLMQQIKKIESDILLWENNLGFFARSKNADRMIADVKCNIDKAQQQVQQLKAKLKSLEF